MDRRVKIGIIVGSVSVLLPILIYVILFHTYKGPVTFGDYLGGIMLPIIGLSTLIITIYLAIEIANMEDKKNERILEVDRKRFLNQLRESEYIKLSTALEQIPEAIDKKKPA